MTIRILLALAVSMLFSTSCSYEGYKKMKRWEINSSKKMWNAVMRD